MAEQARSASLALYARASAHAEARGIILADTKFEFGLVDGRLVWIDEALTPDSSRFWPRDGVRRPGRAQPSFDKQYVRDYLETLAWDKRPPGPALPADVVARTREKYVEALARLCASATPEPRYRREPTTVMAVTAAAAERSIFGRLERTTKDASSGQRVRGEQSLP